MWSYVLLLFVTYNVAYILRKLWQERCWLKAEPPLVEPRKRRVCVIGAGPAGLTSIKQLLDEGHEVICFEKYGGIGGVFLSSADKGGVYDSALLTISNFMMAFGDYPASGGIRYWKHDQYLRYLHDYADKFKLFPHIRFNCITTKVIRSASGVGWTVTYTTQGQALSESFDAVAVCCGAHHSPNIPVIPGIDGFKGEIHHASRYKNNQIYRKKKVVCVGIGETAADVVYEIAQVAADCTLSMRRTPWVIKRNPYFPGFPNDMYTTRYRWSANPVLYDGILNGWYWILRKIIGVKNRHASILRELCAHSGNGPSFQFLVKNDKFVEAIAADKCHTAPAIARVEGNTVHFVDKTAIEADTIVCCTGYDDSITLVEGMVIKDVRQMFKHCYHTDLGTDICFIGWARPNTGGIPACAEMQARYFALLLSGKRSLPSNWKQLGKREAAIESKQFYLSSRLHTLVQYSTFMEGMARLIGCQLPLFTLFFTKPRFWFKMVFAGQYAPQYRIRGPHALPEQSIAFLNQGELAPAPFMIRAVYVLGPLLTWSLHVLSLGLLFGRPLSFDKEALFSI